MFDSPFLYLLVCSVKNRVRVRLRRLRKPKYAVGAIVGGAYVYFAFLGRMWSRPRRRAQFGLPAAVLAPLQIAAVFLVWIVVLARWFVPVSKKPLELSTPERNFLLTAPIPRWRIARYKLLRSLIAILFSTVLLLVFARPAVSSPWSFLLGTFLLFTTARLHLLGIALTRTTLVQGRGRRDLGAVAALVVVLAGTAGAVWALAPAIFELQHSQDPRAAFALVPAALSKTAVSLALLPFSLVLRPLFADWPTGFAVASIPVLALALVNYAWVVRAEGNFEQGAEAIEREVAEGRRAAARPASRRSPFALALRGRPEWAVVWKNLILLGRYATPSMLLRVALPVVVLAVVLGTSHRAAPAGSFLPLAIALCCGLTLFGPFSLRNDLRQDLLRLSVLKTWPVSGEHLFWGEVLAPSLVLSAIVWLLVFVAGALSLATPSAAFAWRDRLAIGLCALIVFPVLILGQVVIQNAAAVLFPGWIAVGPSRPRGVEAMGQQMLMLAGTALLLALGILPGALLGGVIMLVGYPMVGWLAAIPAGVLLAALLVAEIVVAGHFLGRVLDRTDPSEVEGAQ